MIILIPSLLISRKLVDLAIVGVLITYFSDSEYSKVFTLQKAAIFTSVQDVILATLTVVAAWISCYAIRPLRILIFFNCLLHPCKLICFEFAKFPNRDEIKTYVYHCKQYIYSGADPGLCSTLG